MRYLLALIILSHWSMARGQSGQFDRVDLDGGSNSAAPFILMSNSNRTQFISGFDDRMDFYVNNNWQFSIKETAAEDALVLEGEGVQAKHHLEIDLEDIFFTTAARFFREGTNQDLRIGSTSSVDVFGANLSFSSAVGNGAFRVFEDGKTGALTIGQQVGIGQMDAATPLHVFSGKSSTFSESRILVENANATSAVRDMFELVNSGGSRFAFTDSSTGSRWEFSSNGSGLFSVSKAGTGGPELRVTPQGRVLMGPGGVNNLDLKTNGDLVIQGTLTQASDRNRKTRFQQVDGRNVLGKLSQLALSTWSFASDEDDVRHIGPTAQDFRASFDLGYDDETICLVDSIGVVLAAVQFLYQEVGLLDQGLVALERDLAKLQRERKRQEQERRKQFRAAEELFHAQQETIESHAKQINQNRVVLGNLLGQLGDRE